MKIIVDWGLCDGNGNCAVEAPTLFKVDDHDTLHLLKETISNEDEARRAAAAVRACPKSALRLAE